MTNRFLLNLALVGFAIIIGLVIYFEPGLDSADSAQPLTTQLTPIQATRILVERETRDPLSFIKRQGDWLLVTEKQELPASRFQVKALLRLLETTSSTRYAANDIDLELLGLAPPQATIKIDSVEIMFGNTDALEGKRYALFDNHVHLIKDSYQHLINAGWTNFVARRLIPENKEIQRLQLPDFTLTLTDKGQWHVSPEQADVSADAIRQLLDNWNKANALYARRYDGRTSDDVITLEFSGSPEPLRLIILSQYPELILARPDWGIQYHLSGDITDALLALGVSGQDPEN